MVYFILPQYIVSSSTYSLNCNGRWDLKSDVASAKELLDMARKKDQIAEKGKLMMAQPLHENTK